MVRAMAEMSRAILQTANKYGNTLEDLPDEVLTEFSYITEAFAADFKAELCRRKMPKGFGDKNAQKKV